jgi:lysophospholipid hydrolase
MYFLIFILIGLVVLKNLIVKRKKNIVKPKEIISEIECVKETSISESVPYYKYNSYLKIEIVNVEQDEEVSTGDMFYVEEGSFIIKHNDLFVCKKEQNDLYFYALGYFGINIKNIRIYATERSKIWKISLKSINKFLMLTSLKKKVVEVVTEHLKFVEMFIEKELDINESGECTMNLQNFVTKTLNLNKNVDNCIKIINLQPTEVYKKKESHINDLIFVQDGELIVRYKDKDYIFKKGSVFGYFCLFFNCYYDIEIYCRTQSKLKVIDYASLRRNGLDLLNFDVNILKSFNPLLHYIDLCSDWRIYRIKDTISTSNIIYLNEGSIRKHENTFIVKRLSDVILLKQDIIIHSLNYNIYSYKQIFCGENNYENNKIVSIVPNNKETNIYLFSKRLKSSIGKDCLLLDKKDFFLSFDIAEELRVSEFLNKMSRTSTLVLINIENKYSRLAKFLHEISDVVLVVGYDQEPDNTDIGTYLGSSIGDKIYTDTDNINNIQAEMANYKFENVEYVRLYENKKNIRVKDNLKKVHNVLSPSKTILFSTKDYDRLGRYLLGKRIGLVLSGGGARGIAHIGIIQALEEENIPIDIIGGSSMGAFVGALYCRECDNSFVFKETKKFCLKAKNIMTMLLDLTYPLMSLFRGDALNRSLKKIFRNDLIQNMWIEYFCVTTNLFTNEEEVHTSGLAWKYIRASMGLCGYVPPIVDSKGYLVDGGYTNNVPADIMLNMNVSKIIAVDVGSIEDNDYDEHEECFNGFVGLIHKLLGVRKYITMEEIQYRLSFLTSEKKLKDLESNKKIFVIRPDLGELSTMNFKKFDEIVACGYASGKKIIQEWKESGIYGRHFDQRKAKNLRRRYSV